MGKFIVELKEGERLYKYSYPEVHEIVGVPYTEDSAYAHGFTEAESKFREIRDELEKQAYQKGHQDAYDTAYKDAEEIYESGKRVMYQKGLKDAWEAARKIRDMTWKEQREIFGTDIYTDIIALSVSECIEKIRQYERGKEEQDGLRQNIQTIVDQCGYTLDEIAEVLQKMKESDNG